MCTAPVGLSEEEATGELSEAKFRGELRREEDASRSQAISVRLEEMEDMCAEAGKFVCYVGCPWNPK